MKKSTEISIPRRRLQRKLALALFLVLLAATVVATVILYVVCTQLIAKSDSLAAMPIVGSLAEELSAQSDTSSMRLLEIAHKAIRLLPGLRLYLVDANGEIIADLSADTGRSHIARLDPSRLRGFVDDIFWRGTPRYIEDPVAGGHEGLFVAAATNIDNKPYILLGILDETIAWSTTDAGLDHLLLPYVLIIIGVLLSISFLSFVSIYFVLTRRLHLLMNLISEYKSGNFAAECVVSGNDELTELAENAHTMARQIEKHISEISERDEVRRDLIAGVSHDLRAPVSTLKFEAEEFSQLKSVKNDPVLSEKAKKLERVIESLGTLLSQLFELAKLETQEKKPDLIPYPIGELLLEMCERYREPALKNGVRLFTGELDQVSEVVCDPSLIERVLTNLIENAITYTLDGGSIILSTCVSPSGMKVSVTDSGVGIADEEQDLVFQKSYRASRWESRRKSSGGLGLAIVKKLMETQGSSVQLVSDEGKGSCFSFILPFAEVANRIAAS